MHSDVIGGKSYIKYLVENVALTIVAPETMKQVRKRERKKKKIKDLPYV